MKKRSTADIVIDGLVEHEVRYLFCLPGVQNDDFFDALYDRDSELKAIHTRHEQGAAYMALGAAMATGTPQAFCVVPGPGILNTTAALSTGFAVNAPVLSLAGQIPSHAIGKGHGLLHEIPDQLGITKGLTKWAERISQPESTSKITKNAFKELTSGRPRPVGIEVPQNIWAQKSVGLDTYISQKIEMEVDEDSLKQAALWLAEATNPMVVVGSGAIECQRDIKRLAELLSAPVVAFRNGKGILDSRHDLACAMPEGHALWRDTAVVIAIGTRLQPQRMGWGIDNDLKIIHIDIDQTELGRNGGADLEIHAYAQDTLPIICDKIEPINKKRDCRINQIKITKARLAKEYQNKFGPQLAYLNVIREELPEDGIFIDELTQIGFVSRFTFPVYKPRTFLSTGYQGTLGWGLATGLGAQMVKPNVPVISISGDGGFMYNVQEIATAVQHKIPLISIIFNDNAFGNVKRMQQENFNGRTIATDLVNPNFVRLAETFGATGIQAQNPDKLREAIKTGLKNNGPVVIEVPCGTFPSPWDYVILPKIRVS
ncbi:MAG: TPP-binding protein [Rhodospirillaceae bacterium]|nr:TPP-binding protein [Rhodospirillaceae bacterium]